MPRESERLQVNVFKKLLSPQPMGFLNPKLFNASYQFSSSPVLTVLGHLKRGFLEKGEHVCVRIESDQGIRVDKVTKLLSILG